MKNTLFIIFFLVSSLSYAHDYYFAFAEVEYDELKEEIQATLIVSTHDLENMLKKKGVIDKALSSYSNDPETLKLVQKEIEKGFSIQIGDKVIEMTLEGMETQLTGLTNFYFSAKNIQSISKLSIHFDLLMDQFQEQQNKLTFSYRNKKDSYIFLSNKKEQDIIILEK